jgi:hypothetical protein
MLDTELTKIRPNTGTLGLKTKEKAGEQKEEGKDPQGGGDGRLAALRALYRSTS